VCAVAVFIINVCLPGHCQSHTHTHTHTVIRE